LPFLEHTGSIAVAGGNASTTFKHPVPAQKVKVKRITVNFASAGQSFAMLRGYFVGAGTALTGAIPLGVSFCTVQYRMTGFTCDCVWPIDSTLTVLAVCQAISAYHMYVEYEIVG